MKYQKTFKAFVFVCLCCMATILFVWGTERNVY